MEEKKSIYRGIKSYESENKDYFWGRDNEIVDITSIVMENPSTILVGYSGCGKTSLINAGLLPSLELCNYHVIRITPKDACEKMEQGKELVIIHNFFDKIALEVREIIKNKHLKCINKIDGQEKTYLEGLSLWELFFSYNFLDKYNNENYIVVIFDQFEELFRLGLNDKYIDLFFEIYDMLCGNLNNKKNILEEKYKDRIENKVIEWENEKKAFFWNDDETENKKTKEKDKHFFLNFPQNNDEDELLSYNRFVLTMRKEFFFDIQKRSEVFPLLKENIVYIDHLTDDNAKVVINNSGFFTKQQFEDATEDDFKKYQKNIISAIVGKDDFDPTDDIKDYCIDTMILSIVMTEIENRYNAGKLKEDIDFNNFQENNYRKIIFDFYNKQINDLETRLYKIINDSNIKNKNIGVNNIHKLVYEIQKELVSDSGLYRRLVDVKEVINKIYSEKLDDKDSIRISLQKEIEKCSLFASVPKDNGESVIEFRHESLCQYALQSMNCYETKGKNELRYTANVYFTPMGRLDHDNCFVECIFGPWNTYHSIMRTLYFMKGGIHNIVNSEINFNESLKKSNISNSKAVTSEYSFRNEDANGEPKKKANVPLDGFTHIKTKTVDSKIFEMSFWKTDKKIYDGNNFIDNIDFVKFLEKVKEKDKNATFENLIFYLNDKECNVDNKINSEILEQNRPEEENIADYLNKLVRYESKLKSNIPAGYFMVLFYYDEYKRLILKDFYKTTNGFHTERAEINGYTSIHYKYDKPIDRQPKETYYLNLKNLKENNGEKVLVKKIESQNNNQDTINEILKQFDTNCNENDLIININNTSNGVVGQINDKCTIYVSKSRIEKVKDIIQSDNNYELRYYKILDYCNNVYRAYHEKDKNYGYKSKYDEYGREIKRKILYGKEGKKYNFDTIEFIRYDIENKHTNLIKEISYLHGDEKVEYQVNEKIHKVTFDYDDKFKIIDTRYYSKDGLPCSSSKNIYGEHYEYRDEDLIISHYIDKNGKIDTDVDYTKNGRTRVYMEPIYDNSQQIIAQMIFWARVDNKVVNYFEEEEQIFINTEQESLYKIVNDNELREINDNSQKLSYYAVYINEYFTLYRGEQNNNVVISGDDKENHLEDFIKSIKRLDDAIRLHIHGQE